MAEHLRFAACYWYSFCGNGLEAFGGDTFQRPWHHMADPMAAAKAKADIAFEFFEKLGAPYYCFHDRDIAPEGATPRESVNHLHEMVDVLGAKQQAMDATLKLGGENYVLWGGREGYETLLNTRMGQELDQMGRFLNMVVAYKHKISFKGAILLEPKPREPSQHQYDFDTATVYGFLCRYGLEKEVKVNIEANHATPETALAMYLILKGGGFTTGGLNFDSKVRRQSIDPEDLFHGHVGGMDVSARALLIAEKMIQDDQLEQLKEARYAGWKTPLGQDLINGKMTLDALAAHVLGHNTDTAPVSGRQERLENLLNTYI